MLRKICVNHWLGSRIRAFAWGIADVNDTRAEASLAEALRDSMAALADAQTRSQGLLRAVGDRVRRYRQARSLWQVRGGLCRDSARRDARMSNLATHDRRRSERPIGHCPRAAHVQTRPAALILIDSRKGSQRCGPGETPTMKPPVWPPSVRPQQRHCASQSGEARGGAGLLHRLPGLWPRWLTTSGPAHRLPGLWPRWLTTRSLSGFHACRDGVQAGTIVTTLSQPLTP